MDTSIENISFDGDDYKLDLHTLIDDDVRSPSKRQNITLIPKPPPSGVPITNSLSSTSSVPSSIPTFKDIFNVNMNFPSVLNNPRLNLQPSYDASELFQVTRKIPKKELLDWDESDGFLQGKRLDNSKVDKMVSDLELKYGKNAELFDFELDDQLRTRFYKGRFNKNQFSIDNNEGLDTSLNNYLDNEPSPFENNDNKENLSPFPDPLKSVKNIDTSSVRKSNRVFFKTPRKTRTSIPILKPSSNSMNLEIKRNEFVVKKDLIPKSPKRICLPRHHNEILSRPAIKYKSSKLNIFIVESSTGSLNDATKFGTELNASNCDDFPLPEDANEIVQIPTNDDPKSKVQKMAIIKVFPNKYFSEEKHNLEDKENRRIGFYTEHEFENYKEELGKSTKIGSSSLSTANSPNTSIEGSGVEVVGQSHVPAEERKVRFAEVLEW